MPELPDIEVISEFLVAHVVGQTITSADHVGPIVVRNLLGGDPAALLLGRRLQSSRRRGKFLILDLDQQKLLAINCMLSGRLTYCAPSTKVTKYTYLLLGLSDGQQLRYTDQTQMGKVYLTDDAAKVPTLNEQGPDALDTGLTLAVFGERLRRHPGEIKGTLTNQAFLAGIGNAYADEILYRACVYPFKRRSELSADDVERLHAATGAVLTEAIATLRQRVGGDIHVEVRDFLLVHGKAGQPCPRCGTPISQVSANQRITNFCRSCQPGTLIRQS